MKKATKQWLEELRQMPEYKAESLTIQLIVKCEDRRAELGWSYAELARRMGVTRAYVGKLMGGTQNSTVGSLVKLTEALGCKLSLDMETDEKHQAIAAASPKAKRPAPGLSRVSACSPEIHPEPRAASAKANSRNLLVTTGKPNGRTSR